MTIDLTTELPEFLIRTPEQQKRIDEWNATHAPTSVSNFVDPRVEAQKEQRELDRKEAARERIAKMKARMANKDGMPKEDTKGKEWRNGQWVTPGLIGAADYARILRELPTERHRKIFIEKYSSRVKGKVA